MGLRRFSQPDSPTQLCDPGLLTTRKSTDSSCTTHPNTLNTTLILHACPPLFYLHLPCAHQSQMFVCVCVCCALISGYAAMLAWYLDGSGQGGYGGHGRTWGGEGGNMAVPSSTEVGVGRRSARLLQAPAALCTAPRFARSPGVITFRLAALCV